MEYTPRRKLTREFKLEAVRQTALSEALQVSRSGYYAARHRGLSDRQKRQVDLTARIRTIHQASRESWAHW